MNEYLEQIPWLNEIIRIIIFFTIAWLISIISNRMARRIMKVKRLTPRSKQPLSDRQKTIQSLISSFISLIAFVTATLLSLGLFVEPVTLIWIVGLFSAAFGLGARPLISDYLQGISFIFEDTFTVGEKIELLGTSHVEGVIEAISLRATSFRARSGELYIVPNGEIRIVRNFSRGKYSLTNITIKIASSDLRLALPLLEDLGQEAVVILPNLLEPWQVISESGIIGQDTELTLVAKAKFGKATEMRPRLLKLVQERLADKKVSLVS